MFHDKDQGFTLIEMIVVFALIGILVGLALPQYKTSLKKGKETVLLQNLATIRSLIQQYYTDKGKYPASLKALVDDGYLLKLPQDPMTGKDDTWVEVREQPSLEDFQPAMEMGVVDIHSGSKEKALDGTVYETW